MRLKCGIFIFGVNYSDHPRFLTMTDLLKWHWPPLSDLWVGWRYQIFYNFALTIIGWHSIPLWNVLSSIPSWSLYHGPSSYTHHTRTIPFRSSPSHCAVIVVTHQGPTPRPWSTATSLHIFHQSLLLTALNHRFLHPSSPPLLESHTTTARFLRHRLKTSLNHHPS